ncbi:MAG: imidazolonepropionase-like domain-containing protein, partial [Candidatus Acidiferrales bacterium]
MTGCAQLLTLRGAVPRRGRALGDPGIIRDGALLIRDGRIAAVGPRRQIERLRESRRARKLDLA